MTEAALLAKYAKSSHARPLFPCNRSVVDHFLEEWGDTLDPAIVAICNERSLATTNPRNALMVVETEDGPCTWLLIKRTAYLFQNGRIGINRKYAEQGVGYLLTWKPGQLIRWVSDPTISSLPSDFLTHWFLNQ